MPRGLRNFLNMDRPEHHSTDRLKERGVEKGSGRHSTLQGRERSVFNQTNIGTVLRATLGRLLRKGAECVWAFPSATMPPWVETETETVRLSSVTLLTWFCCSVLAHPWLASRIHCIVCRVRRPERTYEKCTVASGVRDPDRKSIMISETDTQRLYGLSTEPASAAQSLWPVHGLSTLYNLSTTMGFVGSVQQVSNVRSINSGRPAHGVRSVDNVQSVNNKEFFGSVRPVNNIRPLNNGRPAHSVRSVNNVGHEHCILQGD